MEKNERAINSSSEFMSEFLAESVRQYHLVKYMNDSPNLVEDLTVNLTSLLDGMVMDIPKDSPKRKQTLAAAAIIKKDLKKYIIGITSVDNKIVQYNQETGEWMALKSSEGQEEAVGFAQITINAANCIFLTDRNNAIYNNNENAFLVRDIKKQSKFVLKNKLHEKTSSVVSSNVSETNHSVVLNTDEKEQKNIVLPEKKVNDLVVKPLNKTRFLSRKEGFFKLPIKKSIQHKKKLNPKKKLNTHFDKKTVVNLNVKHSTRKKGAIEKQAIVSSVEKQKITE